MIQEDVPPDSFQNSSDYQELCTTETRNENFVSGFTLFFKKTMNSIINLLEEIFNCSNNYPHHSQNNRRKLVVISAELNLFKMAQTKCKILLHESDIQAHPPLYIYISRILQIIPKSYEEMSRIFVCQKKILHEFGRIKCYLHDLTTHFELSFKFVSI